MNNPINLKTKTKRWSFSELDLGSHCESNTCFAETRHCWIISIHSCYDGHYYILPKGVYNVQSSKEVKASAAWSVTWLDVSQYPPYQFPWTNHDVFPGFSLYLKTLSTVSYWFFINIDYSWIALTITAVHFSILRGLIVIYSSSFFVLYFTKETNKCYFNN